MSNHEDSTLCIDKTIAYLTHIIAVGLKIPKHFQAMILMVKLSPSMDSIAQVMCQEDNIQKLDLAKIRRASSLVWEQRQGKKASSCNTNKLSTVKRSPNEPPVRVCAATPINPDRLSNQCCTGDTRYTLTLPR